MSHPPDTVIDFQRGERIGLEEAIYCRRKSLRQIEDILTQFQDRNKSCLLTRLSEEKYGGLPTRLRELTDYDPLSSTAFFLFAGSSRGAARVAIVSGGTSDAGICMEAARTLEFYGVSAALIQDVGVTGLWRLQERLEEIRQYPVVIVVAGMEGALFSVIAGLLGSVVIAVPASNGYGVAEDGKVSLYSALSSCAPGVVSVNIDNGFGAACAALRYLKMLEKRDEQS